MGRRETNVPPVGTILRHTRIDGRAVECKIAENGFVFDGKVYPSLTAAARVAAKSIDLCPTVSGCRFWGLRSVVTESSQNWRDPPATIRSVPKASRSVQVAPKSLTAADAVCMTVQAPTFADLCAMTYANAKKQFTRPWLSCAHATET